jgi:hypothetical protein
VERRTCPLRRLMSFFELVFDPTTSGSANVFNICSAMVSPPPILKAVLDAEGLVLSGGGVP